MNVPIRLTAAVCVCLCIAADQPLKSGPQAGEKISATFEPLNVTGEHAGEPHCLVCENGLNPVVMIFAREPSEAIVRLITKIDAATDKHSDKQLGSFVVFLSEEADLADRLKALAKKHAWKHVVLSIDAPAGPEGFQVAKEADVTVVLYREHLVEANHAFRKGALKDGAIDRVVGDVPKILK